MRDGLCQQVYEQRRNSDETLAFVRKQAQVISLQCAGGQQAIPKAQKKRVAFAGIFILHRQQAGRHDREARGFE